MTEIHTQNQMEPQERQNYINAIKLLASSINISRKNAEELRMHLERGHVAIEEREREQELVKLDAEIGQLD